MTVPSVFSSTLVRLAMRALVLLTTERPTPQQADDLVRTAWTEQMRTVLAALPSAVLNVIVPFDALVHSPQRPLFGSAFFKPGEPMASPPRPSTGAAQAAATPSSTGATQAAAAPSATPGRTPPQKRPVPPP